MNVNYVVGSGTSVFSTDWEIADNQQIYDKY